MITAIDPKTALVLIDLQKNIAQGNTVHPVADVLEKAARLMAAFRKAGLPVVIVNVDPAGAAWMKARNDAQKSQPAPPPPIAGATDIVPEIKTQPEDIFITKRTWNAFFETALHEQLQQRGVTQIVLGGISTSIGVEGTARSASELGYNIAFATDAMTDRVEEAHNNSVKNIFPRLGERGTVDEVIAKLP
ncbi:MAG: isochorismatase family protein [Chitinophagaceae bacterium]